MDSRNDKANNRYGLRNREHINHNDGLSINRQGSGDKEKVEEEEEEGNRPHQRRCVDLADNENHEEVMEVPRVIDFERFALNQEEGERGYEENNGQRGTLPDLHLSLLDSMQKLQNLYVLARPSCLPDPCR